jgi:hypothetical protein
MQHKAMWRLRQFSAKQLSHAGQLQMQTMGSLLSVPIANNSHKQAPIHTAETKVVSDPKAGLSGLDLFTLHWQASAPT